MNSVAVAVFVFTISTITAVPLSMVMNSPGINNPNAIDDDDDFTTHTLERLSSAATCLVAGVEYTHGQQIYREDSCEFCLCLDGEMFCWWQDCPPEGPWKDREQYNPWKSGVVSNSQQEATKDSRPTTKLLTTTTTQTSSVSSTKEFEVSSSTEFTSESTETSETAPENATSSTTSTTTPRICTVMGRKYNIGDRLPHDTGNCVECICGAGAQITCSPHQCGPPSEDINDYRPPGLRSAQPDVF